MDNSAYGDRNEHTLMNNMCLGQACPLERDPSVIAMHQLLRQGVREFNEKEKEIIIQAWVLHANHYGKTIYDLINAFEPSANDVARSWGRHFEEFLNESGVQRGESIGQVLARYAQQVGQYPVIHVEGSLYDNLLQAVDTAQIYDLQSYYRYLIEVSPADVYDVGW